ncbi:MAG TPA: EamA family transporter [Actinomycetota bacterium]
MTTESPGIERTHVWGIQRSRIAGYLFGVATAACWATSPILIRKGLVGLPSPLWGVTVGLTVAAVAFAMWLWIRRPGPHLRTSSGGAMDRMIKVAIGFQVLAGLASGLGSVARTIAIDVAPVVVVVPLVQTASLWTIVFASLILGRHVERVTPKLVLGAVLVVVGAALVIVGLEA